jgi:UDP-N-acetylglucosamine 2-epimerase (hydrolysing)
VSTSSTRSILFVTGTRADFGKLKPLISEVARSEAFQYRIFVTGMHMLSRYGSTVKEVFDSGFKNIFSYINQDGSGSTGMDLALANTIQGLGHYVREFPPDLLIVHGDRIEALAGAIVGALHNVLVAHIEGGEVSGTVDELLRHAISKLSHLHFVANEEARNRLIQMGEVPGAVHVIGSPDIDAMLSRDLPGLDQVKERYAIEFDDYLILLYHPVTTELPELTRNVGEVVEAVRDSGLNFVVLYPNNDTGSDVILGAYAGFKGSSRVRLLPSMRFEYFLSLLKHARAIAGNSSAGIREAPVYGIPTVNIGSRQLNRFSHPSILNVPEQKSAILNAFQNLPSGSTPCTYFGTGASASLFMELLCGPAVWQTARQKQFRDLPARTLEVPGQA